MTLETFGTYRTTSAGSILAVALAACGVAPAEPGFVQSSVEGSSAQVENASTPGACTQSSPEVREAYGKSAAELLQAYDMASTQLRIVNYTQQPYEYLCWAASAAMVVSYFNGDSTDRTLEIAQTYAASTSPAQFNRPLQTIWAPKAQGNVVQSRTEGVSFSAMVSTPSQGGAGAMPPSSPIQLSYEAIRGYVDASFPLVANLLGDVSLPRAGHAVVVKGYAERDQEKYVIFNDPYDGQERLMNYRCFATSGYYGFYTGENSPNIPEPPKPPEPAGTSFSTAKTLEVPSSPTPVSATLEPGQEHYYTFMAPAYAKYIIETVGTADTTGALFDAGDTSTVLASDEDSGDESNFQIVRVSAGRRRYYVRVRNAAPSGAGEYGIRVTITDP